MDQIKEIRELQRIELGILLDVAEVCEKHNIPYFLGEGTLLGAIRHKGFIPWDDDVDIVMKRSDYERFLKIAPKALGNQYEVQHPSTVENYWSPIIKVRLIAGEQKYRQRHIEHLSDHNGPYIDIFPVEYVPKLKSFAQTFQSLRISFLRGMLSLKLGLNQPKSILQRIVFFLSSFYSVKKIHVKMERTFKKYGSSPRLFLANLASYHKPENQTVPASVYDEQVYVPFEGYTLPVPKGYDTLLTTVYGDYMTLPPENQQKIHHKFYNTQTDGSAGIS